MSREYSPGEILRELLIDLELGSNATTVWPVWNAISQPLPDHAIICYDTAGKTDGRLQSTGERIVHPGVQIRVRGSNYPNTWNKAIAISRKMSEVHRSLVVIATDRAYLVINVSQQGDIQPLGLVQEGDRNNHNFTINFITTIEEG